jgi:hypothetical protein
MQRRAHLPSSARLSRPRIFLGTATSQQSPCILEAGTAPAERRNQGVSESRLIEERLIDYVPIRERHGRYGSLAVRT